MKEIRPMLYTRDLQGTVDFFIHYLGFSCGEFHAEWGWAAFHRDEVEIMAAIPNAHTPFENPVFTGSIYITVEDVGMLWDSIRTHPEIRICYPLDTFEYGMREFAIYEHNGYLLQFGEEIKTEPPGS